MQTSLFDSRPPKPTRTAPYQPHSQTSRAAAQDISRSQGGQPSRAATLRSIVARAFQVIGAQGFTDEELMHHLRSRHQVPEHTQDSTIRARRIELCSPGDPLVSSGRHRPTRSGKLATVWIHRDHHKGNLA